MATFDSALSYALCCLKRSSLKLKPEQRRAIMSAYSGNDVFVWLPTGYGKSICYQVLPFMFDAKLCRQDSAPPEKSVALVVSPLVSLMVDQVRSLTSSGVGAAIVGGSTDVDPSLIASESEVQAGKYKFLFFAPETIVGSSKLKEMVSSPPLSIQTVAIAVDEAHCVYKW